MAELLLSVGMIIFLCTVALFTIVLVILYFVCRSNDPLLDHTCRAWLYPPRNAKKAKHSYSVLPLHEIRNGDTRPREDKLGTLEKLRLEGKKERTKTKGVDVVRNGFYQRNPEKCPLSIDEPDFYRSGTLSKERGEHESRRQGYEKEYKGDKDRQYYSRSKEHWEPKAKSSHDIYINDQSYSRSRSMEYNIDKSGNRGTPSKSLDLIGKYDERDGGVAPSLYLRPRSLERKDRSEHYVRPRSLERDEGREKDMRDSSSHYVRPRSLERDEGREKDRRDSSSHYVRPRSMERDEGKDKDRRDSSSHYVRPRSMERDEKDERDRKRESHQSSSLYVRPRSMERDERRDSSSQYVRPRSMERDERDRKRESHRSSSLYVRPRSVERDKRRDSSSHYVRPRSMERDEKDERDRKRESHQTRSQEWNERREKEGQYSSSHNMPESLYLYPRSLSQEPKQNEQDNAIKQYHSRSNENMHSKYNYYQNIIINDEKLSKTTKEKAPLLRSSEDEITTSEVQVVSSEVIPVSDEERLVEKDHPRHYKPKDHDKADAERKRDIERDVGKGAQMHDEQYGLRKREEKERVGPPNHDEERSEAPRTRKRDGSERQSRPRSRSIEYKRTRSSHELNEERWFNHKQRDKEGYYLPRTQSVNVRPPKKASSPIARRHTIHLEFHPRSGDVTPVDSETSVESEKTHLKNTQESRSTKRRESSSRKDSTVGEHYESKRSSDENRRYSIPPREDSLFDYVGYRGGVNKPRPRSVDRKDEPRRPDDESKRYTVPPRDDSLSDNYKGSDHKPRPRSVDKKYEPRRPDDESKRYTVPPRDDSLSDNYKGPDHKPRPRSVDRKDESRRPVDESKRYRVPLRDDSLSDNYKGPDHKPRPVTDYERSKSNTSTIEHLQNKELKSMEFSDGYESNNQKPIKVSKDIRDGPTRSSMEHRKGKGPTQFMNLNKDHDTINHKRGPVIEGKLDEPRSFSVENQRNEGPSRNKDLTHDKRKKEQNSEVERGEGSDGNRFKAKEITLENHPKVSGRKSIESTSSGATMESIHREIKSSSIYDTTDDDRLVLRNANQEDRVKQVELSKDNEKPKVFSKRTKSMERVFFVKSIPRSEPTLDIEDAPEVSHDGGIDWQLFTTTGEKVDLKKKTSTQESRPVGDEVIAGSAQLTQTEAYSPPKFSSEKNIDWHLFTLAGQKLDTKNDEETSTQDSQDSRSVGDERRQHQPQGKVLTPEVSHEKKIEWHFFNLKGEKLDKKITTQDSVTMRSAQVAKGNAVNTTSTKESIRHSLESQIKYGEELHTPSENSLPRKPLILTFE